MVASRRRHRKSLRLHGGRMGRQGIVRRARIGALLSQARPRPEPRRTRRIRDRGHRGHAGLVRRRHGHPGSACRRTCRTAHGHRHHERDVLRPVALPRPCRHRGPPRPVPRACRRSARGRRSLRLGHGRRHLQQRVRVSDRVEHGAPGRRRVSVRALRPGQSRKPGVVLLIDGLRYARAASGRGHELEARPNLRAAGIRPIQRHSLLRRRGHVARPGHRSRHLRLRAEPVGGKRAAPVHLRRDHAKPRGLRRGRPFRRDERERSSSRRNHVARAERVRKRHPPGRPGSGVSDRAAERA